MPTIFLPTRYSISPNLMDDLLNGTYMLCRWRSPDMSLGKNPLNPWLSRPLSHKKKKRELNSANKNIRLNFVHTTYRVSKISVWYFVFIISIKVAPKIYISPSVPKWVTYFDYFWSTQLSFDQVFIKIYHLWNHKKSNILLTIEFLESKR